jgi:hypothetical protein
MSATIIFRYLAESGMETKARKSYLKVQLATKTAARQSAAAALKKSATKLRLGANRLLAVPPSIRVATQAHR